MRTIFILSLAFLIAACTLQNVETSEVTMEKQNRSSGNDTQKTVLVELFTSEGCSSCPPADRVLAKLESEQSIENTNVITLAFHVDYWNYLGWKDEFSDAEFSRRQADYVRSMRLRSSYTPQMIVDGQAQFTGSNQTKAYSEIEKARLADKAAIEINYDAKKSLAKLEIKKIKLPEDSEILVAVAEDDLETIVERGENRGKNLKHSSIVRKFLRVGDLNMLQENLSEEIKLEMDSEWNVGFE